LDYFVDSNVIIGYYFDYTDNWGPDALRVFNSTIQKHSGICVKLECFGDDNNSGKCQTIRNEILRNFSRGISILVRTHSPLELFGIAQDNHWKIVNIIQDLIILYENDIPTFINEMRNAKRKFEADTNEKHENIHNGSTVIFHNRNESYTSIYQVLESRIHDPDDIEIILDAHHVELTTVEISFVTGDYNHIIPHRDFILENTEISQITPLGSFAEIPG